MKIIIKILDPQFISAFVFILSIIFMMVVGFWRRRDYLIYIVFMFIVFCASFTLLNGLFNVFSLKVDSVEDYIPAGLAISSIIRSGITTFLENIINLVQQQYIAYTFLIGLIFSITSDSVIAATFISAIFGALTIYMLYYVAKELFDTTTARLTALLLAISPFFIYSSSVILRDTMITFLLAWFFRLWLLYEKTSKRKYLFWAIFASLITGSLRPPMFIVIIGTVMTYKIFFENNKKQPRYYRIFINFCKATVVVLGIFAIIAFLLGEINMKTIIDSKVGSALKYTQLEEINRKVHANETFGSYYYPVAQHESVVSILQYMPLLMVYFLATPFPWQIQTGSQLLALMDSAVLWVVYLLFLLEIRSFIKRNPKWAAILLSYFIIGICASSIVQTNIAGSQKHRIMFTIFMLPFAVNRVLYWWQGKKKRSLELQRAHILRNGIVLTRDQVMGLRQGR